MAKAQPPRALVFLFDEANFIFSSIRSRGIKHYARALVIGVLVVLGARKLIFQSGAEKLGGIKAELEAARAMAQYADTYRELDQNLSTFMRRLPPIQNPEIWLLDAVRQSMKDEGLVALSISPVQISDMKDFRFLKIHLTFTAKYPQIGSWVARMEGSRQLLHVASLAIRKEGEPIGENTVQATISSLAPKGGLP